MTKRTCRPTLLVLLVLCWTGTARSQPTPVEQFTLTFSDPSQPGVLYDTVANGSISVQGYDGHEVLVEVYRRTSEQEPAADTLDAEGLRVIPSRGFDIDTHESDNVITLRCRSAQPLDFTIRVPQATALKLTSLQGGDIHVENVRGEIEASAREGKIHLDQVAGPVVADARDGEIVARFVSTDVEKPMAFVSRDGTIDVTFPPTLRAVLKMRPGTGTIQTDFAFDPTDGDAETHRSGSRMRLESYTYGIVNGGGPELTFRTWEGDIIIRKGQ